MPAFRLISAITLFLLFFVLFSFIWLERVELQAGAFVLLSICLCAIKGWKSWLKELYLLLPFVGLLMLVYLLFGVAGLGNDVPPSARIAYWLGFGGVRVLLLVNTLLCLRVVFSMVKVSDILCLPLGIRWKKYVILGRILYHSSFQRSAEISLHQSMVPSMQRSGTSWRQKYRDKLAALLALAMFVLAEAKRKGEMIDNRILHCHGKNQVIWFQAVGLTVLTTVATMLIRIPMPSRGYLNFGDVVVVFAGLYGGSKVGAIAGGLGSAAADLIGFPIFAPITLVAKGLEGWLCGWAKDRNTILFHAFPALGVLSMVGVYFVGTMLIPQLGLASALTDLPGNALQAGVGYLGGRSLYAAFRTVE